MKQKFLTIALEIYCTKQVRFVTSFSMKPCQVNDTINTYLTLINKSNTNTTFQLLLVTQK